MNEKELRAYHMGTNDTPEEMLARIALEIAVQLMRLNEHLERNEKK